MIALLTLAYAADPIEVDLFGGSRSPLALSDVTEGDTIEVDVHLGELLAPQMGVLRMPENVARRSLLHPVQDGVLKLPSTLQEVYVWNPTGKALGVVPASVNLPDPTSVRTVVLDGASTDAEQRNLRLGDGVYTFAANQPLYAGGENSGWDSSATVRLVVGIEAHRGETPLKLDTLELSIGGQQTVSVLGGELLDTKNRDVDGARSFVIDGWSASVTFVQGEDPRVALLRAADAEGVLTLEKDGEPPITVTFEPRVFVEAPAESTPTWMGDALPRCSGEGDVTCFKVTPSPSELESKPEGLVDCLPIERKESWSSAISPAFAARIQGVDVMRCPLFGPEDGFSILEIEDGKLRFDGVQATRIERAKVERLRVQVVRGGSITASAERNVADSTSVTVQLPLTDNGDTTLQVVTTMEGKTTTYDVAGGLAVGEAPPEFNAVEVYYGLGVRDEGRSVMVMAVVSPQWAPKAAAEWQKRGLKGWSRWGWGPVAGLRYAAESDPIGLMLGGRISFVPGFSVVGGVDFGTSSLTDPWVAREALMVGIGVDAATLKKAQKAGGGK